MFIAFQAIEGTQFSKFSSGGSKPPTPLADESLDVHVQSPTSENTPCSLLRCKNGKV